MPFFCRSFSWGWVFADLDFPPQSRIPFSVVGSDKEVEVNGKKVRGRKYPWGVIEVDNEEHCDFVKLRQMLIRTHMEELKEFTNEVLYENYRTSKLATGGENATK